MVKTLHIRNFALIDRIEVSFTGGLNILSGETGSGKSILVGAIGLIIGGKSDSSMIRSGSDEAVVSALISINAGSEAESWIRDHGYELEEGEILIKRVVRSSGRGSAYLQSDPITMKDLQHLCRLLFDLHGQHEHQSILYEASQRHLVDSYGDISEQLEEFALLHERIRGYRADLAAFEENERILLREQEMLEYAVTEIEQAALKPGEDEAIESELFVLNKSEQLSEYLETVISTLGGESGTLGKLKGVIHSVNAAASIDSRLGDGSGRLESSLYEIEDVYELIKSHRDLIEYSPDKIDALHDRLQLIRNLKRKYGDTIEEVLAYLDEAKASIERFENREENRDRLKKETEVLERTLQGLAAEITKKRRETAELLAPRIENHLAQLGMPNSEFAIGIESDTYETLADAPSHGVDRVDFLISPNRGEPVKPLRTIASGGELSRVMLALKSEFSRADSIETLIFDEIDSGIGGSVATSVGTHLSKLAQGKQILCITHLASIAAHANSHFIVSKHADGERTVTLIEALTEEQKRIAEIARMLSGDSTGESAIAHAKDLLGKKRKKSAPQELFDLD